MPLSLGLACHPVSIPLLPLCRGTQRSSILFDAGKGHKMERRQVRSYSTFEVSESSFALGARVLLLAATNIAACAVALYVFAQHAHRKSQYAMITALLAAHVSCFCNTQVRLTSI